MTDTESLRLDEEAAQWVARLLRPDADRFRAEFEIWLAADSRHRDAYDRVQRRYAHAGILARSAAFGIHRPKSPARKWVGPLVLALAAAGATFFAMSHSVLPLFPAFTRGPALFPPLSRQTLPRREAYRIAARIGPIRSTQLPDGTRVTLDSGAGLDILFTNETRRLRLTSGRVRIDVAHEARPFSILAGNGLITDRGTLFDVALHPGGKVQVVLWRGSVAIQMRSAGSVRPVARSLAGQGGTAFDQAGFETGTTGEGAPTADWTSGEIDAQAVPLVDLIARANHYAQIPIEVGDDDLRELKVSGHFRIDGPAELTRNLSGLFGISVDRSDPGRVVLKKMHS